MRMKRNLDTYYEGLELEQMNKLWGMMVDMKYHAVGLKSLYQNYELRLDNPDRWADARKMGEVSLYFDARRLDKYLLSINGKSIFGTEKKDKHKQNGIREIISQYFWLMEEIKTPEQNIAVKQEKEDKDNLLRHQFAKATSILKERAGNVRESRDILAVLKAEMASSIVKNLVGVDSVIAEGIAVGLELAAPPFSEYEQEKFKKEIEVGDYLTIGMAATAHMLSDAVDERADRILSGVIAVLSDAKVLSEEEKAAKIVHIIFDEANRMEDDNAYKDEKLVALEKVLEETKKAGTVPMDWASVEVV